MLATLSRFASLVLVLTLGASSDALTIQTNFVPAGSSIVGIGIATGPAGYTSGGGNLQTIVRAAADEWESRIGDNHTLTLHFGWFPTEPYSNSAFHMGVNVGGNPLRETIGSLAFNSDNVGGYRQFLDPTPGVNEEFVFSQQNFNNFGGGDVETRREYSAVASSAIGASDLYSAALHEIGHALGLSNGKSLSVETIDDDIDVWISPYAGTALPVSGSHLNVAGAALSTSRPLGVRRKITQADLLAVGQLSQFTQLNLGAASTGLVGDFNADGVVDTADYTVWRRNLGAPSEAALNGNGNGQGGVDQGDYVVWKNSFGAIATAGIVATTGAVPEPTSAALLLIAGLGLVWRQFC